MLLSSLARTPSTAPATLLLLLLLITTLSALPLSSPTPALPLARRSTGSTLSVTYLDSLDGFYPSDATWDCPPTIISISGATFPVRVDGVAIEASNTSSVGIAKEAAFEVVTSIAMNWSEPLLLFNIDGVEASRQVAVRVVDADGDVAYASLRKVAEEDSSTCKKLVYESSDFWWDLASYSFMFCFFTAAGGFLIFVVWFLWYECGKDY